jgi:hypothetical protein
MAMSVRPLRQCLLDAHAYPVCGSVGVIGKQDHRPRLGVAAIDPGIGADEPVLGLGNHQVAAAADYGHSLFLDESPAELLLVAFDDGNGSLCLGDDLVGDHEHVPVLDWRPL